MKKEVHHVNRRITRALAVSALALGLGGAAAATVVGSGHPSHASAATTVRTSSGPYFVCFAVLDSYGACIGPPTNY